MKMEMETCERIIMQLHTMLQSTNLLQEFEIIPALGNVNRSPVHRSLCGIGLDSWCVNYIYSYAYNKIFETRCKPFGKNSMIPLWTELCLLVTPEMKTFWNIRKQLLLENRLEKQQELQLTRLVLFRKPKCLEAYHHRQWMFSTLYLKDRGVSLCYTDSSAQSNKQLEAFLLSELELCTSTANKQDCNYHSWNHRAWALNNLLSRDNTMAVLRKEYNDVHSWVGVHVSEYSGFHYLQLIFDKILLYVSCQKLREFRPETGSHAELLLKELDYVEELMGTFPNHESLFYFRKYLLVRLKELLIETKFSIKLDNCKHSHELPSWDFIIANEERVITSCTQSSYHQYLAERHFKWLSDVLPLS